MSLNSLNKFKASLRAYTFKHSNTSAGFTLLEVLIATFVLAIMSMMIWQITSNAYRGANKAAGYDDIYQSARIAMKRLTDDLSMAFLVGPAFQGKASDGTPAFEPSFVGEDQGDHDTLNLTSFAGVRLVKNEKKSDQIEVGYSVADCPEGEEKVSCLMRRESSNVDKETKEGGQSFVVAKGIKRFNAEYYDPNKQEWRGDWNSKDPLFLNRLPRAARIMIGFTDPKDESGEISFSTETIIPLSTGPIDF